VAGHKERRIGDHSFMAVVGVGSWVQAEMRRASEIKSPEFPRLGGDDREPQLGYDSAGSAGGIVFCSHGCIYPSITLGRSLEDL